MILLILQWAGTVVSISAATLVSMHKLKIGFWLFLLSDFLLVPVLLKANLLGTATLYVIYAGINILGLLNTYKVGPFGKKQPGS
jgi:hypothetical protein